MVKRQTLAAFYQCHQQPRSFLLCLESFRKFYPDTSITVVNDGGYDFRYYCDQIGAFYSYVPKEDTLAATTAFSSLVPTLKYLARLWEFIGRTAETHFILLEDDVRILRRHRSPFQFSINGCNEHVRLPAAIVSALVGQGYSGPTFYGGCGGCVFDREFFANIPFEQVQQLLTETELVEFHSDQLLTFIALFFGGSIGPYDEFCETFYPDVVTRLVTDRVAFLHQYKFDYDLAPTKEQEAVLGIPTHPFYVT